MPIFIRAGKCLPVTSTEVFVQLKHPPRIVWVDVDVAEHGRANYFRFRLSPDVFISLGARAKKPGEAMLGDEVELVARHQSGDEMAPYERLLGDAMHGDQRLFAREDTVEAAWRVVDTVLNTHIPVYAYAQGSWGPNQLHQLIAPFAWRLPFERQWRNPHDSGA